MSKIELLAKIELLNKYEAMMEEIKADSIPAIFRPHYSAYKCIPFLFSFGMLY